MLRTAFLVKKILFVILLTIVLWTTYNIAFQSDTTLPKYKAKHDYSNFYKNKKNNALDPKKDSNNKKTAFMFREDLQPKLVYRGTNEEIDPSDIGLVRNSEDKKVLDDGYQQYAFNSLVSSRLGFFRNINDTRHKSCLNKQYPADLPTASVIICFHNEEFFTLMRSVVSVLRRSPDELIKEIILINDHSDNKDVVDDIEQELKQNDELAKVKLFTPEERLGLIRSRIFGARRSSGDVLVFLDSHVETNVGWLEPLLTRIQESSTNVVTPIIDIINPDNFNYGPSPLVRGGFNWALNFKWISLTDRVDKFDAPIPSPAMAGGLFAMDRKYFTDLGEYDPGLDIWGGENIEISLRIWMCGGRLEILPCSRVGHVFRKRRPYSSTDTVSGVDTQDRNTLRVARVWLGDFIKYYYNATTGVETLHPGDLTERLDLKKRLQCRDFTWYHSYIYPELSIPGMEGKKDAKAKVEGLKKYERWDQRTRNYTQSFQLKHLPSNLCLEPREGVGVKGSFLQLSGCMRNKRQSWYETDKREWVNARLLCLDGGKGEVRTGKCHETGAGQTWVTRPGPGHSGVSVYSPDTGQCVLVTGGRVRMGICDTSNTAVWSLISLD